MKFTFFSFKPKRKAPAVLENFDAWWQNELKVNAEARPEIHEIDLKKLREADLSEDLRRAVRVYLGLEKAYGWFKENL